MHIVLTGGGTAGHVVPNLAIADVIAERTDAYFTYLGSHKGLERELVRHFVTEKDWGQAHDSRMRFEAISTGKLRRYFDLRNFVDLFKIPFGTIQAWWKLRPKKNRLDPNSKRRKADLVFSKGGFVGVPVVWAAWLRRIPVYIHESDAIPGLATKLTAPFARRILLAYEEAKDWFKRHHNKLHIVGNPVRQSIFEGDADKALKWSGFNGQKPVLLIMGGSSGAQEINRIVTEEKERLTEIYDVIHITGKGKGNTKEEENYISVPYIHEELKDIYALVTHVITRAGANTLAELEALRIPSLLYPLGLDSSRGDQWMNAQAMTQQCDYVRIANREKTAHSQLIMLPKRKRAKARASALETIAMLIVD